MNEELAHLRQAAEEFFFGAVTADGVATEDLVAAVMTVLDAATWANELLQTLPLSVESGKSGLTRTFAPSERAGLACARSMPFRIKDQDPWGGHGV